MKSRCFQYIKGTKKKANHNDLANDEEKDKVVSNTSKVLKRKQITTSFASFHKSNKLFPIRQRY